MERGHVDAQTILAASLLLLAGLVILYSASAPFSMRYYGSDLQMVLRQIAAAAAGGAAAWLLARIDYHRLAVINDLLLIGTLGMTVITILPLGIGDGRWISVGPITVQPTEFLKFSLILYLSATIVRKRVRIGEFREGILPFVLVLGGIAAVLMHQPDLGMLLVLAVLTGAMLYLGGARVRHLLAVGAAGLPLLALAVHLAPYRLARVLSFLHPEEFRTSSGYQTIQSLIAIGSGGILGRGLGGSRAKLFYLPQSHNDFILSIAAEETGLIGVLLIIGLMALLVWRAFVIGERAPDLLGRLIAYGIGFAIGLQSLLNIGVVVGLLPVTGLTFPFLSNGGSSLLVTLCMVGVLLNVSRQGGMR